MKVNYVRITKQGLNHTFETINDCSMSVICQDQDKYDQISISNSIQLYEDIKVFPGSVTVWRKSDNELWFKYITLKVSNMVKRKEAVSEVSDTFLESK